MTKLVLNDQEQWYFINGPWARGSDGIFQPTVKPEDDDGLGIQGYRFAFCKASGFRDLQASFRVQLRGHTDAGLILRATDPQHFYLLHFPDCGQASRAQNFWVALSKMDTSGALKILKLSYVRRVASHPSGLWHDVELQLCGKHLEARIDGRGVFQTDDLDNLDPGYLGLMSFSKARIDKMTIQGRTEKIKRWRDEDCREPNWFYPCPDTEFGPWQRPINLIKLDDGQLLLNYAVQRDTKCPEGKHVLEGAISCLLARSSDGGRTWVRGEPLDSALVQNRLRPPFMHLTPGNKLIGIVYGEEGGYQLTQSKDAGRTWSPLSPINVGPVPADLEYLRMSPQGLLNLRDGSMLMLLAGKHRSSPSPTPVDQSRDILAWGKMHCQAYTCRSSDDGQSWSEPVPADNPGCFYDKPITPNLDLTEISAVEVADGQVMALIRPLYAPWMWESWSQDGGKTWGPAMRGPFPGYAACNMIRTSSGAILIAHRLPGLTVNCSFDGGMNWDQGTIIDSAVWAMGSMVEVEPDLVLYIYWDSNCSLMRGQFLRVNHSRLQVERMSSL